MPMTGNGSVLASYSTRPTSCLSWSNESPACSSSCVSAVRVECVEVVVMASGCRGSRKVCNSTSKHCAICPAKGCIVDALDATLLDLFAKEPRIGVLEASRRLGVARGTVQARLDKLEAGGIVTGWGPDLDPEALGYPRSEEHTSELQSPMRSSYAVFCLKKKN